MKSRRKTISIKEETYSELDEARSRRESFDGIISRLVKEDRYLKQKEKIKVVAR